MSSNPISGVLAVLAIAISLGVAGYVTLGASDVPSKQDIAEPSSATLERANIETIVREYLLENPELILEVQTALETKKEEERVASQRRALNEQHAAIFGSENQTDIGDPDAPITIVEFFDYNCGYCQRALDDMQQFIENDPQVRFVLKEFPVLGEASLQAHKVSLAFTRLHPDKAGEFHTTLLGAAGRKDGEMALKLAVKMGADPDAVSVELDKPYIMEAIREVYKLADELGINGTPSYVVGDEVVFGAVGFASLNAKVEAIKECGTATC